MSIYKDRTMGYIMLAKKNLKDISFHGEKTHYRKN